MTERSFAAEPSGSSPLDQLRQLVSQKVHRPPVTLLVPDRPGWRLRFDANIRHEQHVQWERDAITVDAKGETRVDTLGVALRALAQQNEAIIDPDGVEVTADGGTLVTFKTRDLWEWFGVANSTEAVRAFFGTDPHCIEAALKLNEAAGYYQEVPVDPTAPPSSGS